MSGLEGPLAFADTNVETSGGTCLSPTWAQVVKGRMSSHTMVLRRQTICPGDNHADHNGTPSSATQKRDVRISEHSPYVLVDGDLRTNGGELSADGATPASSRSMNLLAFASEELRRVCALKPRLVVTHAIVARSSFRPLVRKHRAYRDADHCGLSCRRARRSAFSQPSRPRRRLLRSSPRRVRASLPWPLRLRLPQRPQLARP